MSENVKKPSDITQFPRNSIYHAYEIECAATNIRDAMVRNGDRFQVVTLEMFTAEMAKGPPNPFQIIPKNAADVVSKLALMLSTPEGCAIFCQIWAEDLGFVPELRWR